VRVHKVSGLSVNGSVEQAMGPQSSAIFSVQKEYFDDIDTKTRERIIGDVVERAHHR
jgi:hypothetical protein